MNERLTLLATIEILSALSMGIFILAATYQSLKYIGKKRYDIHPNNYAYGIFMAAILFSVGYTMSSVIQPLISLFRIYASRDMDFWELGFSFLVKGGLYILIAFVMAIVVCFIGILIYTYITPIDEFAEIKNNNISVALVVGSIIVTLSLLTQSGIALLIESFIPYPEQFPK
jgi:uncharacterized membrane protein YjfL (UPF0719 family)